MDGSGTQSTVEVTLSPVGDLSVVEAEWRELEARAEAPFFRSWTWVGCLAAERFTDPFLARAVRRGRLVGLALFNRHGRRWHRRLALGESGDRRLDSPFVEHNGPLLAAGEGRATEAAMIRAALAVPGIGGLRLSGVNPSLIAAAREAGAVLPGLQERRAPFVGLDALRSGGVAYLDALSANTRQQLRRSNRRYAAEGPLAIERAGDVPEALGWLEGLIALHGAAWRARGQPGAFAEPFMTRFHQALIAHGVPRGEVDLLRATAGSHTIGFLYNFRFRGHVCAYQSGFDYAVPDPHAKPGLTSHHLAIERALAAGDHSYDFLGGDDRYKRSLATDTAALVWAEAARPRSLIGLAARARRAVAADAPS